MPLLLATSPFNEAVPQRLQVKWIGERHVPRHTGLPFKRCTRKGVASFMGASMYDEGHHSWATGLAHVHTIP